MAQQLGAVLSGLGEATIAFLPNLVAAIILLVIGLVVGKIVGRVVKEILVRIKLDYYISETHKPPVSASNLFGVVARWWIYLAFITAALSQQVLGVPALSEWISNITAFIPNIIGAALIVVVGFVVGEYIKTHIASSGKAYGRLTGKVLLFFILYVSVALALPILGVNATLVNNILLAVIVFVGLAFALAFGLGAKDTAGAIAKKWAKKVKLV
jgi:hypothetical protein